jgi:YHS domain-containing protein
MLMKKWFGVWILVLFVQVLFAQDEAGLRVKQFNLEGNLALKGYDPVAYFTMNKAMKGSGEYRVADKGVTYYFVSAVNRDLFQKDPFRYEPQYGGWCAYAMGKDGSRVPVDPETFKISNGKLFLFYNQFFNNTLKTWNKDEANLHARADANWQKMFH